MKGLQISTKSFQYIYITSLHHINMLIFITGSWHTISLSPITLCGPSQVANSKPLPSYLNFEPSILCKPRKHSLGLLESIHLPLLPLGFCHFLQNNFIQVYDQLHSTHHLWHKLIKLLHKLLSKDSPNSFVCLHSTLGSCDFRCVQKILCAFCTIIWRESTTWINKILQYTFLSSNY